MSTPDKYTTETLTDVRPWTESLFSFRTTRDRGYRFVPGQFARLGVRDRECGEIVWRAYSIASAAYDEHLEFFSVVVPGGAFTSRLSKLREGDPILVERRSYGFLSTDRFEGGRDLWMLATGTGLAPFLSILHDFNTWEHYENLVLVQSVRTQSELAYEDLIRGFDAAQYYAEHAKKLRYVRISRAPRASSTSAAFPSGNSSGAFPIRSSSNGALMASANPIRAFSKSSRHAAIGMKRCSSFAAAACARTMRRCSPRVRAS